MSGHHEPTRMSPTELWAMLGEHPNQRANEMLAERLHLLAGVPDMRSHRMRRLMARLQTMWSRPYVPGRLLELSRRPVDKPVGT